MRRGVIDRFECEIAVIELDDKTCIDVSKKNLPPDAAEGDVVMIYENGTIKIDKSETERLKKEIESLMDDLFE